MQIEVIFKPDPGDSADCQESGIKGFVLEGVDNWQMETPADVITGEGEKVALGVGRGLKLEAHGTRAGWLLAVPS